MANIGVHVVFIRWDSISSTECNSPRTLESLLSCLQHTPTVFGPHSSLLTIPIPLRQLGLDKVRNGIAAKQLTITRHEHNMHWHELSWSYVALIHLHMYTVFSSVFTHTCPLHALPVGLYFAHRLKRDLNRWEQSPYIHHVIISGGMLRTGHIIDIVVGTYASYYNICEHNMML